MPSPNTPSQGCVEPRKCLSNSFSIGGLAAAFYLGERIHSCARRSRNALPITDTELKLIAAAAIIGFSNIPVKG